MSGQTDYDNLRRRAEKRVHDRQEFFMHLSIYVAVNLGLWLLWALLGGFPSGFPWPLLVTLGWGIGLAAHGIDVYFKSGSMAVRREMAIEREMQREMQMRGLDASDVLEKPKREQVMRLSDDGELVPADDEGIAQDTQQKSRRSNRQ
ncbi:MAG: 2TM domain-containing protein [Chloroflexota bacterium]